MPVVRSKSVNACPECGREFERKHDLLRHSKMHDPNAKKHKCPEPNCSFSTLQKSNLITHMVIHTGTKPFACPSCDFATADPASLTRHRRRAHDYVPYRSAPRKKTATIAAARLSRQNTDPTSENSSPTTSTPAPASSTRRGRGRADRRSTNLQVTATTAIVTQPTRVPSPVPSLSSSSESEPPTPPPSTPDTIESSLPASIYPSSSPAPVYVEHSILDIACPPSSFFTGTVTGTVATEPQTQSYNYNYDTQAEPQPSGFGGFTGTGIGSSDFPSTSESPYQWDLNQGLTSESPFSYSFSEYGSYGDIDTTGPLYYPSDLSVSIPEPKSTYPAYSVDPFLASSGDLETASGYYDFLDSNSNSYSYPTNVNTYSGSDSLTVGLGSGSGSALGLGLDFDRSNFDLGFSNDYHYNNNHIADDSANVNDYWARFPDLLTLDSPSPLAGPSGFEAQGVEVSMGSMDLMDMDMDVPKVPLSLPPVPDSRSSSYPHHGASTSRTNTGTGMNDLSDLVSVVDEMALTAHKYTHTHNTHTHTRAHTHTQTGNYS